MAWQPTCPVDYSSFYKSCCQEGFFRQYSMSFPADWHADIKDTPLPDEPFKNNTRLTNSIHLGESEPCQLPLCCLFSQAGFRTEKDEDLAKWEIGGRIGDAAVATEIQPLLIASTYFTERQLAKGRARGGRVKDRGCSCLAGSIGHRPNDPQPLFIHKAFNYSFFF